MEEIVRSSDESSSTKKEEITSKLDSILLSINKMAPIVKNMEDNLPGFMKMKEVFDRETLGLENSENENEDLISKDISDEEDNLNNVDKTSKDNSDIEDLSDKNLDLDRSKSSRPKSQSTNPLFRTLSFGKENTTVIDEDTSVCISKVLKEGMDREELKNILDNII